MASKIKKALKKIGKAALIGGAGYLAMKGLGKKKSDGFLSSGAAGGARLPKGDRSARAIKAMTSNDAYNDDTMPGNLSRDMGQKRKQFMPGISENMYDATAAKGGRIVKTKGGGKAVRGLGRAFTKRKR